MRYSKEILDSYILNEEAFEDFRDHILFYLSKWESSSKKSRHRKIRQLSNMLRDNFPDFYLKVFSNKFILSIVLLINDLILFLS